MRNIYLVILLFSVGGYSQKTGVNTKEPKVVLEIADNTDSTIPNGLKVPQITGVELREKDELYTANHDGIMVFVIKPIGTAGLSRKTEAVTEQGYYYYNGIEEKWEKLDRYTNIVAEKVIAQVNRPLGQQRVLSSGTAVSWNDISTASRFHNDVSLEGSNQSILVLGPGKSYKISAIVGVGTSSSPTYLKTQFKLAEVPSGSAKIYLSSPGTVQSSSVNTAKGAGTYPVCYVYSGQHGIKLILEAKGPVDNTTTYIAGKPVGQYEGTLLSIQEL